MICKACFQTRRRSFFDAAGVCEDCPTYAGPAPVPDGPVWPLPVVVALAAKYHDSHVWVTEGEARDRGTESSAKTLLSLIAVCDRDAADANVGLVPVALDWARDLGDIPEAAANDYQCAVYTLYRTGWVTPETFPLACSIYHAWWKDNLKDAKLPEPKKADPGLTGRHYGTERERVNIPLCQCTELRSLGVNADHPEWGERFLIRFTAGTGEELVWFASAGGKFDPQPGGTYNVRATVHKHDVYNGRASTIIQRCTEFDPATGDELAKYKRTRKKVDE